MTVVNDVETKGRTREAKRAPDAGGADYVPTFARPNFGAIAATWRRQLGSLLLNPLGYVFILVFVLASSAILYWPDAYFARNIADLGPLLTYMPWLLVVLLPALAMNTWALERELGTEEQLLTLPLSPADALVGKWLAVVSYFTIALLFSLSNVIVLAWLGRPDGGMVFANYLGWWLAGLVFAAFGVLASALVPLPALAFVSGVLLCAAVQSLFWKTDWFDPFNRGLLPLGRTITALALAALALGIAALALSIRRWSRARQALVIAGCVIFFCLCLTGINLGAVADRAAADADVTAEHLSSLSPASRNILGQIKEPVKVVAFISDDLPPELQPKGKEVENTLKVLDRQLGGRLKLELHHPKDPLDESGSLATQFYGLTPRKVVADTVTGRQEKEVFLAAAVTSGPRTQKIEHFDPGLSVEYELVRAIRAVGTPKKKVVGIAHTDMQMMGGFNFQSRSSAPKWQIVSEWERQYDVREVNLDAPVAADVDVLVVPQPSRLGEPEIRNLHDYVWAGRPALIMEDPLPIFSGPQMATSQPKMPDQSMGMMPPQSMGGGFETVRPLFEALGLMMAPDEIVWSDFNPSHAFRDILPPAFVWSYRDQGGINATAATTGIQALLLPFPGSVRKNPLVGGDLTVTTLVRPSPNAPWGTNTFSEHVTMDPLFGMRKADPQRYVPQPGDPPALAVEVTGKMKRVYPFPEPPTTQPATQPATRPAPAGVGEYSPKPVHVIFVADTDLAHDQFFDFYRNADNRFNQEELRFLQDLRNVQFLGNAVDALAGDEGGFLELRTRRPQRRPLEKLEQLLTRTQTELRDVESSAKKEAEAEIQKLRDDIQQRLDQIRKRTDLDENAKRQLVAQVDRSANRQLETQIREINRKAELRTRRAEIDQQRAFERTLNYAVRARAMGFPTVILAALALAVFAVRQRGERLTVPESRRRDKKG